VLNGPTFNILSVILQLSCVLHVLIRESSQVYFIATFKTRKRKQRKTIQSPSQLHLYSITLNNYNKRNLL